MKKNSLLFFILIAFSLICGRATAQNYYKTAVGLKFGGYENGISVKYFTMTDVALEGVLGFRDHGAVITGLYEIHTGAFDVAGLKFYYGGGAHVGAVGSGVYQNFGGNNETYTSSHILLGIDGAVGLEYMFPNSPIAISLDLNPRVELTSGPFFDLAPGLGLKYTF
jgi:hypothetical protein